MKHSFFYSAALVLALAFAQPATAQEMTLDRKQPIEITADSLEVSQNEQEAVFVGNVMAIQGDMRITSDRMHVFYRSGDQLQEGMQSISRIEVHGNVFMASPTENARSHNGVYNVDVNELTLHGDVVLTRGENIVKGESLRYDLTTGKSRIIGADTVIGGSGENAEDGGKGRVRGLFMPGNAD